MSPHDVYSPPRTRSPTSPPGPARARASSCPPTATSSPTRTSSRAPTAQIKVKVGDGDALDAKLVGEDASTDLALLKVVGEQPQAAHAGRLEQRRGRRPGVRDRQPVRPRPHAHRRRGQRAPARDRLAQRLLDRRRDPDRRRDQPRQLGRPAVQRGRPGDRRQLADRVPERELRRPGRQRRHRLRDPVQHGQERRRPAARQRQGQPCLPRRPGAGRQAAPAPRSRS